MILFLARLAVFPVLLVLGLFVTGCNQPPEITQVGDHAIANSFLDFLHDDISDSVSFEAYVGETLTFRVIAEDPEGGPIRYAAGPLPIGAEFDEHKGMFEWTPTAEQGEAGEWIDLYLVAMDEQGAWDALVVGVAVYAATMPGVPEPPRSSWDEAEDALWPRGDVVPGVYPDWQATPSPSPAW